MFVKIFILIMNISISTAHHVDIDYTPAGIFDRILATLIDGAFQFGLLLLGFMFIDLLTPVDSPTWFFVILSLTVRLLAYGRARSHGIAEQRET